jgi:hypothetical protein
MKPLVTKKLSRTDAGYPAINPDPSMLPSRFVERHAIARGSTRREIRNDGQHHRFKFKQ